MSFLSLQTEAGRRTAREREDVYQSGLSHAAFSHGFHTERQSNVCSDYC